MSDTIAPNKINRHQWFALILSALIAVGIWMVLLYPQLTFIDLSVNRQEALKVAQEYLTQNNLTHNTYQTAATLRVDEDANRYLQKTIGYQGLTKFINEQNFDLFYWTIRFFKENEKEEFHCFISSASGNIIGFKHIIPETATRAQIDKSIAKTQALDFLHHHMGFNSKAYNLKEDSTTTHDHREDFRFSWQKKDVHIPWSDDPEGGTGKILVNVTVSGPDILAFNINHFKVPDKFQRSLTRQRNVGKNIFSLIKILRFMLLIAAVYLLVTRHNHLAMHLTKKCYIIIALGLFTLSLISHGNHWQSMLMQYKTTASFTSFFWDQIIHLVIASFFMSIIVLMPGLAGELLHYEHHNAHQKEGGLLHYIRSTFWTRRIAQSILLGYLICLIMAGLQAVMIQLGQEHMGVWIEQHLTKNLSTAAWPFLGALCLGLTVSFSEEIFYRLFAINLGRKIFKNTTVAVIVASLIWGFAHSLYPVFPAWFRGLEVFLLGLFLSVMYLRFGFIPVLVAHYLFDVFWHTNGFLFGTSNSFHFTTSLMVLLLPLFYAGMAFILNRPTTERAMHWRLNQHQQYNLTILKTYLNSQKNNKSPETLKKELQNHGWDPAIIDIALKNY